MWGSWSVPGRWSTRPIPARSSASSLTSGGLPTWAPPAPASDPRRKEPGVRLPHAPLGTLTPSPPDPGDNPFGRYLQDPWGTLGRAARYLLDLATTTGSRLLLPVAAVLLLGVVGRVAL